MEINLTLSLKVTGDNELVSAQQIQTPMIAAQEIAQTRVFKRDPGTPSNNSKSCISSITSGDADPTANFNTKSGADASP